MVKINSSKVTIGGRSYGKDKSSYPAIPTVFSGVEVNWGAESCIDHPEPSRATLSLWVPKTHEAWVPALGDVVSVDANMTAGGDLPDTYDVRIFTGKVEGVKLQDDHKTPTILIPNSRNMAASTGWVSSYSPSATAGFTSFTAPDMVVTNRDSLTLPFKGGLQRFKVQPPQAPVVGGKKYAFSYASNFAGNETVNYTFYNASNAVVSSGGMIVDAAGKVANLTAPSGATKLTVEISTALMASEYIPAYVVGPVTLAEAGVQASGGYRVNVTAADALAEAGRLRLSSTPWPYEHALNRQNRVADLATKSGVNFYGGLTEHQGYYEATKTMVIPRDVDSFSALEAFQRATMASGHTVLSANNTVQPSVALKLPQILSATQPVSATYSLDTSGSAKHVLKNGSTVVRTNWATNATGSTSLGIASIQYFSAVTGGGVTTMYVSNSEDIPKNGSNTVLASWTAGSTGTPAGLSYKQSGITGATGTRVSGGMWFRWTKSSGQASTISKLFKVTVTAYMGAASVGTVASSNVLVLNDRWTWIPASGITTTGAYDTVEVAVTTTDGMQLGNSLHVDGVLIEKTATAGAYFDAYSLDPAAVVIPDVRPGVPAFDASAIVDDVFEIDTSKVVNEIKVELNKVSYSPTFEPELESFDQTFTDEAGTRKTTPQQRSITTDWAVNNSIGQASELVNTVMVVKGKLLLAGQSKAQWRLSSALSLVLGEVDTQESIYSLMRELDRFGALIRLTNAPALVPEYMRVRGGRIVLGEEPALEFDLEPVEYSAPIPLSGTLLQQDHIASNFRIRNAKTLTFNDLRTIGAR